MTRRFVWAVATAAAMAATYGLGQRLFAFYVECGWWTWPFCGF